MNITNKVKAINERLASYERRGKTDSPIYKKTIAMVKASKMYSEKLYNKGVIRLSRSKGALQNYTSEFINRLDVTSSIQKQKKRLEEYKKEYTTGTYDVEEFVEDMYTIEEKLDDLLFEIYKANNNEESILDEEMKVYETMKKGNWTYKEMASLIRDVEKKRAIEKHSIAERLREL